MPNKTKLRKLKKLYLTKKMANYLERNKKLSPLNTLEYIFMRDVYRYLTKQILNQEFKKRIYKEYCKLMDLCFFPNRDSINPEMVETIYLQCLILLERDFSGPKTFILLNKDWHYYKMRSILELFYNWALNEEKGHYLDEKEFWETMEFIRKEFNKETIDIYYQIGKWPKKLRKRFKRLKD